MPEVRSHRTIEVGQDLNWPVICWAGKGLPLQAEGSTSMSTIAIQSFNFQDHFVRHVNFLAELTPVGSDLDRLDATFFWSPGLADGNLVSFESRNFSAHFLRHQDFRVKLQEQRRTSHSETAEQQLFREDATFVVVPGLADLSAVSFRSYNFHDRYLRHRNFHLYIEPVTDDQALQDATFVIAEGFVPPRCAAALIPCPARS